jgi:hypothetical protein
MQSASRIVQSAAAEQLGAGPVAGTSTRAVSVATSNQAARASRLATATSQAMQEQPILSNSGMKKSTKVMIYLAAGVGLAATAWTIDHKVVDVTPSSLGRAKAGLAKFILCVDPSLWDPQIVRATKTCLRTTNCDKSVNLSGGPY